MKKLLYVALSLFVLIGVGIASLLFLVDPNQFKDEIATQVQKTTGQELVINGDIGWQFFPSLGFNVGAIELKNPPGFKEENLVQFSGASLSVSVLPLLSNTLDIGKIELNEARIFLQTLKDGSSNIDPFTKGSEQQEQGQEPVANETANSGEPWSINLAGVAVNNASLTILDDKAGTVTKIERLDFELDRFSPGTWSALSFNIIAQKDAASVSAKGKTELFIFEDMSWANVKNLDFTTSLKQGDLHIESASLAINQLIVGKPSEVSFSAKGTNGDMAFDSNGEVFLTADKDFSTIVFDKIMVSAGLNSPNLPNKDLDLEFKTKGKYAVNEKLLELNSLKLRVDETKLTGTASYKNSTIPVIRFDLKSDEIDLDTLLALDSQKAATTEQAPKSTPRSNTPLSDVEPDLSALKNIDLAGTIDIGKLKANNIHVTAITTKFTIKNGIAQMPAFSAQLYEGKIAASAKVDSRKIPASYVVKKDISGVQAEGLLKDLTGKKLLSGTMDLDVNLRGTGLSQKKMRSGINGTITADLTDGAIWGVNIPKMVRKANGVLKGTESLSGLTSFSEDEKTDFSTMNFSTKLGKGIATVDKLYVSSPAIEINGDGQSNLLKEDLDFLIKTTVSETLKKQEDVDLYGLKGSTIPIEITGTWQEPSFQLALDDIIKQKAQKEVEKGLEKLFNKDKSTDGTESEKTSPEKLLKGLFQ